MRPFAAPDALAAGQPVAPGGVEAFAHGDGLRVRDGEGEEVAAHRALWFARSQFHPETELWSPPR